MRRALSFLILLPLALLAVACEPPTATPPYQPTFSGGTPHPDADGVFVLVDSIGWAGSFGGAEYPTYGNMGWTARDPLATGWLQEVAPEVHTLVITLGTNDASPLGSDHGLTTADYAYWYNVMQMVPHACVAIVLPHVQPNTSQVHIANVNTFKQWMTTLGVNTVDWSRWATQPGVLNADGIHLEYDADLGPAYGVTRTAVDARNAAVREAVQSCAPVPPDPQDDAEVIELPTMQAEAQPAA